MHHISQHHLQFFCRQEKQEDYNVRHPERNQKNDPFPKRFERRQKRSFGWGFCNVAAEDRIFPPTMAIRSWIVLSRSTVCLLGRKRCFSTAVDSVLLEEISEANSRYAGKISIRQTNQYGWGLYALQEFDKGDLVMQSRSLKESSEPDAHSIQVDWNRHVTMDLPARFINHICNRANVGIRPNDLGAYDFFALRQIHIDEELSWDYETAEYEISAGFVCSCGDLNCRRELKGFKEHGDEMIRTYGKEYIAPYLLESN